MIGYELVIEKDLHIKDYFYLRLYRIKDVYHFTKGEEIARATHGYDFFGEYHDGIGYMRDFISELREMEENAHITVVHSYARDFSEIDRRFEDILPNQKREVAFCGMSQLSH